MVKHQERGYIALLSVLVIGAAAVAISLALLVTGADSQRVTLIEQQSQQAHSLAVACAEESLQLIHDNIAFSGNSSLSLGQGNCTYTIAVTAPSTRSVVISGTVGNVVRKIQFSVTINTSTISVTSWQEVG